MESRRAAPPAERLAPTHSEQATATHQQVRAAGGPSQQMRAGGAASPQQR
jgi:hypothetical protein